MISTLTALEVALEETGKIINEINVSNGWDVPRPEDWSENPDKLPRVLCLIHSEVSEALEAYRKHDRENFEEELADIFIRVVDLSYGMGVDLAGAVVAKLKRNRDRGHKHGGKRV